MGLKYRSLLALVQGLAFLNSNAAAPMNPNHDHQFNYYSVRSPPEQNYDYWSAPFLASSSTPSSPDNHNLNLESNYAYHQDPRSTTSHGMTYHQADLHHNNAVWDPRVDPHQQNHFWNPHVDSFHPSNQDQSHHYQQEMQTNYKLPDYSFDDLSQMQIGNDPDIGDYGGFRASNDNAIHLPPLPRAYDSFHQPHMNTHHSYQVGPSAEGQEASQHELEQGMQINKGKHDRLHEYVWQENWTEDQVLKVYEILLSTMPPALRSTNRGTLDRMNAYLEHHPFLVPDILHHDPRAIHTICEFSKPLVRVKRGENSQEKDEEFDHLMKWLLSSISTRTPTEAGKASWAPLTMNQATQEAFVKVLHIAWMKCKASVRQRLKKLTPEKIAAWIPEVFSNNPVDVAQAAAEIDTRLSEIATKKHREGVARSKEERSKRHT